MGSSGQSVLRILKHKSLNLNMPGKDDDRIDMTNEGDDEDSALGGCVGTFLWIISMFLIVITFPLSLFVTMKQVKQYERAVILRLGKLKKGGPFGPGLFFVVPCLDDIITVDLRTVTFDVPSGDPHQGQCYSRRGRGGLLQGVQPNVLSGECGKCLSIHPASGIYNSSKYSWNQKLA